MWIIYSKNPHTMADPEFENALELRPKRLPIFAFEIKGEDVLVFLGRIFRILNGAVRAFSEPFRVFADIGMIGRTLKGDIKCNQDLQRSSAFHQVSKVLDISQLRMDRFVASFRGADCPGTSRFIA